MLATCDLFDIIVTTRACNVSAVENTARPNLRQTIVWTRGRYARRVQQHKEAATHGDITPIDCRTTLLIDLELSIQTGLMVSKCSHEC